MGLRLLLRLGWDHTPRDPHGLARLSPHGHHSSNHNLVRHLPVDHFPLLTSPKVHREPPPPLTPLTFHTSRRARRMGLCVRRAHERVLPPLPRPLSCPALLATHRTPG